MEACFLRIIWSSVSIRKLVSDELFTLLRLFSIVIGKSVSYELPISTPLSNLVF